MRIEKSRFAYIAPTYKQGKNIAWDILKEYASKVYGVKFNIAELRCDFGNGSRITIYGADNPDSLRGLGLWGVIFDEYSQQPSNIFTEIIRPALADHKGYAIWVGTPKGKNEFYRLYENSKTESDWLGVLLTVDDTGLISDKELEDARKVMTEDEFQQEWYCSFEAAIKGAYYAKVLKEARDSGRITRVPYEKDLEVYTFWDLGIDDATAIGFFQIYGKEIRMIDYFENTGFGLDYYVKFLRNKPYIYKKHYFPHDIEVRELITGKTRRESLEKMGIRVNIVKKISIEDGINACRMIFNKVWFDEDKCAYFLDAISQYRAEWDDRRGKFRNMPYHDWTSHAADMFRYMAITIQELYNLQDINTQEFEHKRFRSMEFSRKSELRRSRFHYTN